MAMEENLGPQFVKARDLQVGHKVDRRSRLSKVFVREDKGDVLAQSKVQGSTSPGVHKWGIDDDVRIY